MISLMTTLLTSTALILETPTLIVAAVCVFGVCLFFILRHLFVLATNRHTTRQTVTNQSTPLQNDSNRYNTRQTVTKRPEPIQITSNLYKSHQTITKRPKPLQNTLRCYKAFQTIIIFPNRYKSITSLQVFPNHYKTPQTVTKRFNP